MYWVIIWHSEGVCDVTLLGRLPNINHWLHLSFYHPFSSKLTATIEPGFCKRSLQLSSDVVLLRSSAPPNRGFHTLALRKTVSVQLFAFNEDQIEEGQRHNKPVIRRFDSYENDRSPTQVPSRVALHYHRYYHRYYHSRVGSEPLNLVACGKNRVHYFILLRYAYAMKCEQTSQKSRANAVYAMQCCPSFYLPLLTLFPFFFLSLLANVFSSSATSAFLLSRCTAHCSLFFFILLVAMMVRATTLIDGNFRPFLNALALAPSPRRSRSCSSSVSLNLQPIAASWSRLILLLAAVMLA